MTDIHPPLIVGAGPTGLGAALFLACKGIASRIIDVRREPAVESRALAVNPRTLEILEPLGLTSQILELGLPIRGARFYRQRQVVAELNFAGLHPRYPFLVALSQANTERLLTAALKQCGGHVERGVRLEGCRNDADDVEALLQREGSGGEVTTAPWLFAADGAHSTARAQQRIDFPGSALTQPWYLADVPLRSELADDYAHVFFLDEGFLFLIRVVDDTLADRSSDPIWRVIGIHPDPLSDLVGARATGAPIWASSFHVSHRVAARFTSGRVYLAGDAAHLHSPVGARGMNLGLEDAWVFAQLASTGRLDQYDRLRRPIDRQVVRSVERLTWVAAGESPWSRRLRALLPYAMHLRSVRNAMRRTVSGLDHTLPDLDDSVRGRSGVRPGTARSQTRV